LPEVQNSKRFCEVKLAKPFLMGFTKNKCNFAIQKFLAK